MISAVSGTVGVRLSKVFPAAACSQIDAPSRANIRATWLPILPCGAKHDGRLVLQDHALPPLVFHGHHMDERGGLGSTRQGRQVPGVDSYTGWSTSERVLPVSTAVI